MTENKYKGEISTHSVQNTQLSRIKGRASEHYFAYQFYEWADSEDLQLIEPDLDRGWDFMIEATGKRIQVKRFNPIGKNHNQNNIKLRRCRASPERGTTCNNNYSMDRNKSGKYGSQVGLMWESGRVRFGHLKDRDQQSI